MLRYAEKLTLRPGEIVETDVDRLRQVGFGDEAIGDIAIHASMYAYMNRIVDSVGQSLPRGMDREAERIGITQSRLVAPVGDD